MFKEIRNNKVQVVDHKNNTTRDAKFSDFAILTRSKKNIKTYEKILKSYNMVVEAQTDISFKVEPEIIVIKNIFNIIENNYNIKLINFINFD